MRRRRIKSGKIRFISLVPKGANRLPVIFKDDSSFEIQSTVSKFDEAQGLLTAVVYAPEARDSQGDIASSEVIQQMAHDFAKEGGAVDFRHSGMALGDKAHWVESFIVQKGDPRFAGLSDYAGDPVNAEGGWGIVIKIEDPDLKAKCASGELNGVSMAGTAAVVTEAAKEEEETEMSITAKELNEALAQSNAPLLKAFEGIAESLKKEEKRVEKAEATDEAVPVFKGDPSDPDAILKHGHAMQLHAMRKSVDWSKPAEVVAFSEQIREMQKSREACETPEQRGERLAKENAQLKAQLQKHQGGSNRGAGTGSAGSGGTSLEKELEDPQAMAAAILKEAGSMYGYKTDTGGTA